MPRLVAALLLLAVGLPSLRAQPLAPAVRALSPDGQPYLVHAWTDDLKTADGGTVERRVEVRVDPRTGATIQSVFAADGTLLLQGPTGYATPSAAEVAAGAAVIAADSLLAASLQRPGAVLDGAFILLQAEGARCGPGSRCLQYDLFEPAGWAPGRRDRVERLQFVVVDLVTGTVAFSTLKPARLENRAFAPSPETP